MTLSKRKFLRLGLPLLVAALYLVQTLMTFSETGELSLHYAGGVLIFLAVFAAFWFIERNQP